MPQRVLTISQLNEYVEGTLKHDPILRSVSLRGEVSNLSRNGAFFTLKDEFASVRCALFGMVPGAHSLADGAAVILRGYVSLYAKTGQYQFYVQEAALDGMGELAARFEAYKAELGRLGYFDAERKRPLPYMPRCIGIVTSPDGAVIHDIERVAHRRLPCVRLLLCPARVQGEGAAREIARAIEALNCVDDVDVLIVGRGGGAAEDLWAFNERVVADAIYRSRVPVISAVGHETDVTIADFVADLRAPTPSAAAELAVPNKNDLLAAVFALRIRLERAALQNLAEQKNRLERLRFAHALHQPNRWIEHQLEELKYFSARLKAAVKKQIESKDAQLRREMDRLDNLGPLSSLRRGYALVLQGGRPVQSVAQLSVTDAVIIAFADGSAAARIESTHVKTTEGERADL